MMEVARQGQQLKLLLEPAELQLLRRALERASFVDTPAAEQTEIQDFCEALLKALETSDSRQPAQTGGPAGRRRR